MYKLIVILLAILFSCKTQPKKERRTNFIEGKWIILWPDHSRMDGDMRKIYGKIQDSILDLKMLKLVSFDKNAVFYQADSLNHSGHWTIKTDNGKSLKIGNGGQGFSPFNAVLREDNDSLVILTETMSYKGQSLELDWHFKRLKDDDAGLLLAERNKWRVKPARVESPEEIKKKLQAMLEYYSVYYYLVEREASYFMGSRILMPFNFYQHAMGLRPLSDENNFQNFFFNDSQAEEAYGYLETAMDRLHDSYPSYQNTYVKEYAAFMELLSKEVAKMID